MKMRTGRDKIKSGLELESGPVKAEPLWTDFNIMVKIWEALTHTTSATPLDFYIYRVFFEKGGHCCTPQNQTTNLCRNFYSSGIV